MSEHEAAHALLSPSSAERWSKCPASVRVIQALDIPDTGSVYANQGTACHALAEIEVRYALIPDGLAPAAQAHGYQDALAAWRITHAAFVGEENEMRGYCRTYVNLLRSLLEQTPNSVLLLEQKLPTGIPSSWGTSDAVIVSPEHIIIVDLKYGLGVKVEAAGNPQLRLYGVGALEAFGDYLGVVEEITCMVFQPRLEHVDSETLSAHDLREWRDSLIPVAELALTPGAPFGPSETACRWCPASGNCTAQVEFFTALDFAVTIDTLSTQELADILPRLDGIEAWCKAVRESAFKRAHNDGEDIPGYKVVMSRGKRYVSDDAGVIEALDLIGIDRSKYTKTTVVGIGELTKLGVIDTIAPYIGKTEGKPTLAPIDDERLSITPGSAAAADFAIEA